MLRQWESRDRSIRKNVLAQGDFTKTPNECSTCDVLVENINVTGMSNDELREKYHTEILDGNREKVLVIGEASAEIDCKMERVIQMMTVGEKSLVTITMSRLDDDSSEPMSVQFELTLTKYKRHKPIWMWSPEEKYEVALKYKKKGVELFIISRYVDAFYKFSRACKILITLEPISDMELDKQLLYNIRDLRLTLYNNMASCHLKRQNYDHTVSLCDKVLDKDKDNAKALYKRGVAFGSMRNIETAVTDLKKALALAPDNHNVIQQFSFYNKKLREANKRYDDMVKRMFKL